MDTKEIMANEEVIKVTEEIGNAGSGKSFKVVAGISFGVLVGVIAYKYIIKPKIAKIKAAREEQEIEQKFETVDAVDVNLKN